MAVIRKSFCLDRDTSSMEDLSCLVSVVSFVSKWLHEGALGIAILALNVQFRFVTDHWYLCGVHNNPRLVVKLMSTVLRFSAFSVSARAPAVFAPPYNWIFSPALTLT